MFEIVSCIANIATTIMLMLAVYQLYSDRKRTRRMATLDAYDILQKNAFDVMNQWSPKEIEAACEDRQSEMYKDLSVALARIEHFCVGINYKIYDIGVFYEMSHGFFDEGGTLYCRMMPIIENKLFSANEDYFKNIHIVLNNMKKRNS